MEPKKPETTRPIPTIKPDAADSREITRPTAKLGGPTTTGLSGRMDLRKLSQPAPMTAGMQKHRRYVEKMKKQAAAEKYRAEADRAEQWSRNQKLVLAGILIAIAGYGYYRVQSVYSNRWPIFTVWITIVVALIACFVWIIWFIDKKDY